MLNRDAILSANDLAFEDVPVPEWGGDVRVRMMTGAQRDAHAASLRKADGTFDPTNYQVKLLTHCLVDEAGALMFPDPSELNGKNAVVLTRLFVVADRLNGTSAEAVKAAEKN